MNESIVERFVWRFFSIILLLASLYQGFRAGLDISNFGIRSSEEGGYTVAILLSSLIFGIIGIAIIFKLSSPTKSRLPNPKVNKNFDKQYTTKKASFLN